MLSVVPPAKFEGERIQKLVRKIITKRGFFRKKPLEDVIGENIVWMPYHRIQFSYGRSKKRLIQKYGETGRGETALNAMFCGSVKSERELFMLFRPNYLKHKMIRHSLRSEEIVGPTFYTDFEGVLGGFLERLNEVKDELNELRRVLNKSRARIRMYSVILPVIGELKEKIERLSEKVARLNATKICLNACLNINEDVRSIRVTAHNIFYYPTLVVMLKHKENGTERYLIINLVEDGLISKRLSCDKGLTELCDKSSACKEIIARSIMSSA